MDCFILSGFSTVEVDVSVEVVVSVFFTSLYVDPFPDTALNLGDPSFTPRAASGVPSLERGVPGIFISGSS